MSYENKINKGFANKISSWAEVDPKQAELQADIMALTSITESIDRLSKQCYRNIADC